MGYRDVYHNEPTAEDITLFTANKEDNIQEIKDNLPSLYNESDRKFCASLTDWYDDKGFLSTKQIHYLCKFWLQVTTAKTHNSIERLLAKREEASAPRVFIDGSKILALLDKARSDKYKPIENPRIKWKSLIDNLNDITFYITGVKSKYPDNLGVCTTVRQEWTPLVICHRQGPPIWAPYTFDKVWLQQKLKKLIEEGAESFVANGQVTGICCFCGIHLVTHNSIAAGYGPVCADKYGLPWGVEHEKKEKGQLNIGLPK